MRRKGFTLIELIVVIAIIAILAAIIAPNAFRAIEKAKISRAIAEIKVIKTAVINYYVDVGQYPPLYYLTTPINPFLSDPGVTNWNGPYVEKWNTHPWGGAITWRCNYDVDASGGNDCTIGLDDDRPGTDWTDNQGMIPKEALLKIDAAIDDGNLSSGKARGNGPSNEGIDDPQFFLTAEGEISIMVVSDGNPI